MEFATDTAGGSAKRLCLVVLFASVGVFGYSLGRESGNHQADRADEQLELMREHLTSRARPVDEAEQAPRSAAGQMKLDVRSREAVSVARSRRNARTNS
jgi:hypothetical protein